MQALFGWFKKTCCIRTVLTGLLIQVVSNTGLTVFRRLYLHTMHNKNNFAELQNIEGFVDMLDREKLLQTKLTLSSLYTQFNTLKKFFLGKHCGKKVKLLKMSNSTFSHNVFYAICILKSFNSHVSLVVCSFFKFGTDSKWFNREWVKFNPFPNKSWFLCVCSTSLLKTEWEKQQFLFFQQCFLPIWRTFLNFHQM